MADRVKALARIAKVQDGMVKLAEWRIAAAARQIGTLDEDRALLVGYVGEAGGLGVPIAKAALRSMLAIDARRAEIERARAAERARLEGLRRRDRAISARAAAAVVEAGRAAEKAELAAVLEAWLAQPDRK